MSIVTATIRVVTDETSPLPVDGVNVLVYSEEGVFLSEGITGSSDSGEVEFPLFGDAGGTTYVVRLSYEGYSFPPGPTKEIVVHDPETPVNVFEFEAHYGETEKVVSILVVDDQPVPEPVDGVKVRIYDEDDVYITEATTDEEGLISIALEGDADPGKKYIIRLSKTGTYFTDGPTQEIDIYDPVDPPMTNSFEITAHAIVVPESSDEHLCMLSGYLTDQSLRPLRNRIIRFVPKIYFQAADVGMYFIGDPTLIRGKILMNEVKVKSDTNGYVEISLPRGGAYEAHIYGAEHPEEIVTTVSIPDKAGARLEDVLFPYVTSVVYGEDPIDLLVSEYMDVPLTVTLSNDVVVTDPNLIDALLSFTADDSTIVTLSLLRESVLTVYGLKIGSTEIQVARKDLTAAPRMPILNSIIVTPPTVEVT